MLGISAAELFIIGIMAIIFIPAKEIPTVIQFLTKRYRQIQTLYTKLLRELNVFNID